MERVDEVCSAQLLPDFTIQSARFFIPSITHQLSAKIDLIMTVEFLVFTEDSIKYPQVSAVVREIFFFMQNRNVLPFDDPP